MSDAVLTSSSKRPAWPWALAAVAVFGLLLWSVLEQGHWLLLGAQRQAVVIGELSYAVNADEWQGARSTALRALSAAEADALAALEAELDARLAELFALPRAQVSGVADWYYSVPGQVVRAGSAVGVDVSGRLLERLFPPEAWQAQQAELVANLAASADSHLRNSGDVLLASFHRELRDRRLDSAPPAEAPVLEFAVSQSAVFEYLEQDPALERQALALATGALSTLAARRAAQAATARAAGRQAGAGITAACVSTGAAAWLCAAGVFGVTMLSAELVLMRLDEIQNRAEFEAALQQELDRLEAAFGVALRTAYLGALTREFHTRQASLEARLRPIDVLFATPAATNPSEAL